MLREIARLRQAGKSDAQIRAALLQPTGLPYHHPCAGPSGENLCSATEVDARIIDSLAPSPREGGGNTSRHTIMIAVGVALVLFLMRRKK